MINMSIEFAHKMSLAYSATCKTLCRELKLPQTAFDILMFLANNPDYKTASDIVEVRKIKANLVSVNVEKLVRDGYLERKAVEGDRRKVELICTKKAEPVIENGKKLQQDFVEQILSGVDEEKRKKMAEILNQMEKNLDKVESGKADWRKTVDDFYQGFAASLEQAEKNMEGKKVKVPDEPSSEVCDLCGRPMVIKVGKYGKFLACSGFPECRGTKRLVKDTGGICPKCGKGRMLERKSSKGRIYYGCERYPDCDFMTWDMPVPTKCPKCGSTMFRKGSKLYCAKEGCGYEMPVPKKD